MKVHSRSAIIWTNLLSIWRANWESKQKTLKQTGRITVLNLDFQRKQHSIWKILKNGDTNMEVSRKITIFVTLSLRKQ